MLPIGFLSRCIYMAVIKMPKSFLVPMVALMLIIGAFMIQNSYSDILIIMFVLGIKEYWTLGRFGFPAAPIVLGPIARPIAEQGFAQSLMIGRAKDDIVGMFFGSGVSFFLITCIIGAIALLPLLRKVSPFSPRRERHV